MGAWGTCGSVSCPKRGGGACSVRSTTFFLFFLFLAIVLLCPERAVAHPVIYKGGAVYWGQFTSHSHFQKVNYTFHPRFSFEVNGEFYRKFGEYRDVKLGVNSLVKRWLFHDSQGNIYASLFGGYYRQGADADADKDEEKEGSGDADTETDARWGRVLQPKIELDWESRRLYTALSASSFFREGEPRVDKLSYRLGFAPYVAGMNALQAWMIVQLSYFKGVDEQVKVTPMMRFFYNNTLWEIGSDLGGGFFLTLMVHY